jgi:hypothetical protein
MTFSTFKKIIEYLEESRERSFKLHQLGIDVGNHTDPLHHTIELLINALFGEVGSGWIDWYLYERKSPCSGKYLTAYGADGKEICHNVESLWETVEEHIQTHEKEKTQNQKKTTNRKTKATGKRRISHAV